MVITSPSAPNTSAAFPLSPSSCKSHRWYSCYRSRHQAAIILILLLQFLQLASLRLRTFTFRFLAVLSRVFLARPLPLAHLALLPLAVSFLVPVLPYQPWQPQFVVTRSVCAPASLAQNYLSPSAMACSSTLFLEIHHPEAVCCIFTWLCKVAKAMLSWRCGGRVPLTYKQTKVPFFLRKSWCTSIFTSKTRLQFLPLPY